MGAKLGWLMSILHDLSYSKSLAYPGSYGLEKVLKIMKEEASRTLQS